MISFTVPKPASILVLAAPRVKVRRSVSPIG
jgi:hypothetical protein